MADGARPERADTSETSSGDDEESIQKNLAEWERRPGVIARLRSLLGRGEGFPDTPGSAAESNGSAASVSNARREMIERVIAFDSKQVVDVLIPRADIIAVEKNITLTELLKVFSDAGHSRLPVYRGDLDDPVGMVHIRDLVGILADPESGEISDSEPILDQLVRKILYVPPSMAITNLLLRMQASRVHMALVIDEFGGTDGLVTIEDLVEEIVGDIQDEHDEEEDVFLKAVTENAWEANARLPLEDLENLVGVELTVDNDEIDTLGGLVFSLAGRVPVRGEVLSHQAGVEFEVLDADPRRIRKIKLRKLQDFERATLVTDNAANGK